MSSGSRRDRNGSRKRVVKKTVTNGVPAGAPTGKGTFHPDQPDAEAIAGGFVYKPQVLKSQEKSKVKQTNVKGPVAMPVAENKEKEREMGIPEGAHQGLVCTDCMNKYTKAGEKKITVKKEVVQGAVMLTAGGARPGREKTIKEVQVEELVKGFRHSELAKELPESEDNIAYLCKKCVGAPLYREFNCVKCSKPIGGKAGVGGARLCNRHADPQRCFRCGE